MQNQVDIWKKFYKRNFYFHKEMQKFTSRLIPKDASVLQFDPRGGELLAYLKNKKKLGVSNNDEFLKYARKINKGIDFIKFSYLNKVKGTYNYIIFSDTLSVSEDIQDVIFKTRSVCNQNTRILVYYFNYLWKPVLDFAEKVGMKVPSVKVPNWLTESDVDNLFYLESFERVKSGKMFLFPYKLPFISDFINRYVSQLPFFQKLCFINYAIYKISPEKSEYSVSVIIPARNEEGNIKGILKKIPNLGKETEVIFIEGHSKDNTYEVIKQEVKKNSTKLKTSFFKQKGVGKADAVWLGFEKARNDILMILDADLTVKPGELRKFYNAVSQGKGELIIGSRLIYPLEKEAMRTLNILGNKFFSLAFSFLLNQKIKDTLCGTKVLSRSSYERIKSQWEYFRKIDPFGDFDLIFGASRLNLKIVEIPIRYKERVYGSTNISRFRHGLLLLKMVIFAARKLKFV